MLVSGKYLFSNLPTWSRPLPHPNPPKHLLHRVSGNLSQADFLNSFEHLRYAIKTYLTEAGFDFSRFADILDFGCGVGRFAFAFESEFRNGQRLWGCDVFEECARWCRDHIDFAEIRHTNLEPPLPYSDEQFDLVYALSVFTHLRLDLQFTWVWELHRLLRPGGIVFATFHGRLFMPLLYQIVLNTARKQALYSVGNEGLFAYVSSSGEPGDEGQVGVASAQTMEFIKEQFSAFELLRAFPQSDLAGEQDLYIFRKPDHGRPIAAPLTHGSHTPTKECSWIGKIARSSNFTPVSLRFTLQRHRWFRVYPRILVPTILPLNCQIEIRAIDGPLLSKQCVALNNQRLFGPSHYFVIDLEVPEYDGEVIVNLVCLPRGSSSDLGVQNVEWNFPNFT